MLKNSGKLTLLQHCELADSYPLTGYFVGGKRMVPLKQVYYYYLFTGVRWKDYEKRLLEKTI